MSYQSKDWDPLEDSNSCLCVNKLICCIHFIHKLEPREKHLTTVNKWEKSIAKYLE
ncbi:hypothetical protein PC129_g8141 [Phytophthora cactorum]|nr:hypothetical protein PC111_g8860 [Phytophthora cactorum]KAG2857767.1 hypothetical protein PC113_g10399 [Phytophthora cactorum]KAG2924656.1 hypothetical protein PC115_g8534 [Phytophthora cactorum]KAG2982926.1 hypothetical protein PC118_g9714 [Phytophthora cactorum]KAG3014761.1 hypothetical protein PC120_g12510 [Phytophthora cactorum]